MPSQHLPSFKSIAFISAMLLLGSAQAHYVWIEQPAAGQKAGNATFFFGYFGGNLREASPGLLDKFPKPVAIKLTAKGEQALPVSKTAGGFAIDARAAKGESIVAEEPGYPLSEHKEEGKTVRSLYHPAARLVKDFAKQDPKLTLDLVPTGNAGKDGVEVQAFYKGRPLAKAKVEVVTASGWSQTHHSDETGKLRLQMPWRGTYVLKLSHSDKTAGERVAASGPEKYDRASYVTSLTLMQPAGIAALPAPPPATPNK
ncbi:DUF4198 domain-containing protein [Polaromonas sp.]|uniref:DUF4198 domain-containing protein n=1 Tax=Polaromonas sp. TaxID=1869339 RepID=UPI0035692D2D